MYLIDIYGARNHLTGTGASASERIAHVIERILVLTEKTEIEREFPLSDHNSMRRVISNCTGCSEER